jgi:hypothetical protein
LCIQCHMLPRSSHFGSSIPSERLIPLYLLKTERESLS